MIEKVLWFATETGFSVAGLTFSPVKGPEGNIEYLTFLKKKVEKNVPESDRIQIAQIVSAAHEALD